MTSKLTAVISVKNIADSKKQLRDIIDVADVVELRLDYLEKPSLEHLQQLTKELALPYILTLRHPDQGGFYKGSEQQRLDCIRSLVKAKPDYLDLESIVDQQMITEIKENYPDIKIIRSFHDFNKTPDDLNQIFATIYHPAVDIYKIITYANNSLDSLRMLNFINDKAVNHAIIGHCMGEDGIFSRLVGAVIGNYFTYCAIPNGEAVVKHQLDIQTLTDIYHLNEKNADCKLYALIGDPVIHSIGHVFHNRHFHQCHLNALYVKIRLEKQQLSAFFTLIKTLNFKGMSVTMPLKNHMLPFVDNESNLDALNTIKITDDNISAINTDGLGALDAIENISKVANKRILILGAGGAAAAIADSAIQRKAHITIANRTLANGEKISQGYPVTPLDYASNSIDNETYDIIINTLPFQITQQPLFIAWLSSLCQPKSLIMDINYNRVDNPLEQLANSHHCQFIRGEQMYKNQAIGQLNYWFNKK